MKTYEVTRPPYSLISAIFKWCLKQLPTSF